MNTITPAIRRELVRTCNRLAGLLEDVSPQEARDAERLAARIEPRKKIAKTLPFETRKERKKTKASGHRESTSSIRPAVFERAGGRCEAWHPDPERPGQWKRCEKKATVWDHWLGGTGRRRQKQSVSTTWALCDSDNFARTEKIPSTEFWNDSYAQHCAANDIPFVSHIEHAQLPQRTA